MAKEDQIIQALSTVKSSIRHIRRRTMRLGRYVNDVLETTVNATLPAAYVWVFDPQGDKRVSSPAKNLTTEYAPGVTVIVAYNVDTQEDDVIGVDTILTPLEHGTGAISLNSGQKSVNTSTPVSARDLVPGGVFASSSGGLDVRIGAYWHENGYYADATALTLVPTVTSGRKSFAVVGVNRLTNAATYALTTDRAVSASLISNGAPTAQSVTDIMAVVDANPHIDWRGAVELANGATEINPAKIVPLNWQKPSFVGADGSTAGERGLVPAPAATDNVKALFGNGTWQSAIKADGTVAMSGDLNLNGNDLNNAATVLLNEGAAPSTPAANKVVIYAKTDGLVYAKDDAGAETPLGGSGTGIVESVVAGTNISVDNTDPANPVVSATASPGGGAEPSICEGRLTLTSGTPITTTDVTAAGTLYFTPHNGKYIGLYDGASAWELKTFSELSITLSGLLPHSLHDVFIYNDSGTPTLELTAWTAGATGAVTGATNATPIVITSVGHGLSTGDVVTISGVGGNTAANGTFRITSTGADTFSLQTLAAGGANVAGSGAYTSGGNWYKANYAGTRATALTTQDSIYVKTGATTRRYLGTIRITRTAGECEDSIARRFVWNLYNPVQRRLSVVEAADSWSYTTTTIRALNNNWNDRVEFVMGLAVQPIYFESRVFAVSSSSGVLGLGVGLDTTTANSSFIMNVGWNAGAPMQAVYLDYPTVGYHYLQILERGSTGGTFYGDVGTAANWQSGGFGTVWG